MNPDSTKMYQNKKKPKTIWEEKSQKQAQNNLKIKNFCPNPRLDKLT